MVKELLVLYNKNLHLNGKPKMVKVQYVYINIIFNN